MCSLSIIGDDFWSSWPVVLFPLGGILGWLCLRCWIIFFTLAWRVSIRHLNGVGAGHLDHLLLSGGGFVACTGCGCIAREKWAVISTNSLLHPGLLLLCGGGGAAASSQTCVGCTGCCCVACTGARKLWGGHMSSPEFPSVSYRILESSSSWSFPRPLG